VPGTKPSHRNIYTHLTAAVVVPGCIVLCWWQVSRALSGNTLSWAYVFEWPIFAGYGVFMWWRLIHDQPAEDRSPGQEHGSGEAQPPGAVTGSSVSPMDGDTDDNGGGDARGDTDTEEDEELASYNRYLAALNASGKRKHW